MIFEQTIMNHDWYGTKIGQCFARCFRAEIRDGFCTTETEYYSVIGETMYYLKNLDDTFQIDVDQPLRPQILAHFEAIFGSNNEG